VPPRPIDAEEQKARSAGLSLEADGRTRTGDLSLRESTGGNALHMIWL
jgi:hypothetical protein